MGDGKGAVDAVVVGDGKVGHPFFSGDAVHLGRFGETFRASDFLENPLGRSHGKFGMNVQIDFHGVSL
jgi:hypothetical protein